MKLIKRGRLLLLFITILVMSSAVSIFAGCDIISSILSPTLVSIEIDTSAAKTTYQYQEELDTDGLLIKAKESNGKTYLVDAESCTFTGFNSYVSDMEQEITVQFKDVSATYKVAIIVTKDHILEKYEKDINLSSSFIQEGKNIINEYSPSTRTQETLFYGASNFAMWDPMETDLMPYKVQNHAFGGSTDKDLVAYAPYLLYPYNPQYVFFQTGSNDYIYSQKPTDAERIQESMDYKKEMFELFHQQLPEAKFIVMAGILLPNRSQYVDMTIEINNQLEEYCEATDYLYFVDSESMTYNVETKQFDKSLFLSDGIHLTPAARIQWAEEYIIPMLEELDAPQYDESEIPVNPEVTIDSVALESIDGVPTLTVKGKALNVTSLRLRLGYSTTDLYLSPLTIDDDGSFIAVCDLNEFAENNSKTLTENGYYNVTIQHDITDTGANTNNRTLAQISDIIAGSGQTIRGEKYDFKFMYWSGNVALVPTSWYYDDLSASIVEEDGKPILTVSGTLGNLTKINMYLDNQPVAAEILDNGFTIQYDLSNLQNANVYYPLYLRTNTSSIGIDEVSYDKETSVVIDDVTYSFVESSGSLAVTFTLPQPSEAISASFSDKNGVPYLTVSGETTESDVWVRVGSITEKATKNGIYYSADINAVNTMFRAGAPESVQISYDNETYVPITINVAEYDALNLGVYRSGQHRNEYFFTNYNGTLAIQFSQIYSTKNLKDGSMVDVVTVTDMHIGEENALGRIFVEGTYNTEYISSITGNATDGNTANPSGASASGLEEGHFSRYWSMMESVLNASMGRPDSDVICNIKYNSKDETVVASDTFQLMDAQSMLTQSAISYESLYSSQTTNDFSKNVYSYGCTKYFYYGNNGTMYIRYLTNVVEQRVYVRMNETTNKPELVLEGYFGTATKAQLHVANGTNGATPGSEPPSDSLAYSQIVTGESRDSFIMVVDISNITTVGSNSLRIYNNADGDDNMARYYNVKPQYFTSSQTTEAPVVEYNGFKYTVVNVNNYLRLSVAAV